MTIAQWASRIILILLIILSVWSVSIIIDRRKFFKQLENDSNDSFWQRAKKLIQQDSKIENVERNFQNFVDQERPQLEKGLPVLGTLGGTAPFIGLLGTILGIIKAFAELSANAMNPNKIMFLLAEALILTAVGLAIAIPSVIAFNFFQRKVKQQIATLRIIKNNFQNEIQKNS